MSAGPAPTTYLAYGRTVTPRFSRNARSEYAPADRQTCSSPRSMPARSCANRIPVPMRDAELVGLLARDQRERKRAVARAEPERTLGSAGEGPA